MASKKQLKREIQDAISDIVEEAYSFQLFNPGKKDKEVDALIDKSVDVLEDVLQKINSARGLKDGKEVKKHFAQIRKDFDKSHEALHKDLNKIA